MGFEYGYCKVRDLLLRRLKANFGERRLNRLADYMTGYIQQQISLPHNSRIAWQLGPEPHWTALAYTRPGEALEQIRTAIEQALKQADAQERVRLASLVESYGDLLQEAGFAPILTLAQQLEAEPSEELPLSVFSFETVTVNNRGKIIKRETKQARYFTEDLGDGVTLEMVYIPGGTFLMGSLEMEKDSYESERPQHQVTIPPFFMAKYPITQAQWKAVANWPKIQRDLNPDPSDFKGDNRPVENVQWYDAVEFCARLLQRTGRNYCLPSEAQWEYACRAGTQTPFYFGETITSDLANYDARTTYADEPKGKYREETTPVGEFPPNAFGLYDLHGNVWEWCADPWHENYKKAPTGGEVWGEKNDNDNLYQIYDLENLVNLLNRNDIRVLRGGSWYYVPGYCRGAYRNWVEPVSRLRYFGFRIVSLPPAWTL
ncbi:Formylglycine-generating enzyme [Planktothrix tepida]|uniref:Sulfatase-modifying factor enzyme-like domain-containing protein n=1 Tax=Planktothrix tepida PCC 9214 TaxID=671072 RepID=A0A1J1LQ60_9CYAN|nr:Formylglycine-generating enzyme [Planktothrix tepida]CUR34712.1 conserved hypothetical protein [Planktothrix tepida PCC 9214]